MVRPALVTQLRSRLPRQDDSRERKSVSTSLCGNPVLVVALKRRADHALITAVLGDRGALIDLKAAVAQVRPPACWGVKRSVLKRKEYLSSKAVQISTLLGDLNSYDGKWSGPSVRALREHVGTWAYFGWELTH